MTEFKFFYWILTSAFNLCNSVAFKIFNTKNKSQFLSKYGANDCSQYYFMPNATKQACTCRIDQANKQSLSNTWTIKLNNNTYAIKSYKSKHISSTISYCGPIQQKSIKWFFMEGAKRHHKCSIRTDLWCITNRLCFTQDNFWCFWYFGTWKKEKILKTINNEYLSFIVMYRRCKEREKQKKKKHIVK